MGILDDMGVRKLSAKVLNYSFKTALAGESVNGGFNFVPVTITSNLQ